MSFASSFRIELRRAVAAELGKALRPLEKKIAKLLKSRPASQRLGGRRPGPNRRGAARALAAAAGVTPRSVRATRDRLGMTRPRFARLAGVSTWTVFMWEHGKVAPSGPSIARLRKLENLQAPKGGKRASAGRRGGRRKR